MRRYGQSPERGQTYRDRPGCYGFVVRGDEVLLTIEHGTEGPEIQLPGGGVDAGEPFVAALHREVLEETGWRIGPARLAGIYQSYRYMPEYDLHARKIHRIYVARAIARLSDPLEGHHDAFWAPASISFDLISNATDAEFLARNYGRIAGLAAQV